MDKTFLSVLAFTQPPSALSMSNDDTLREKGFISQHLWFCPKIRRSKFADLRQNEEHKKILKENREKFSKYIRIRLCSVICLHKICVL